MVVETTACEAPQAEQGALEQLMSDAPASVGALLARRIAKTPDKEAFRFRTSPDGWETMTWAETGHAVDEIAAGLLALGVQSQDRVAIACGTRIEWVLADFAVMRAGAATTTVYPTTNADEVEFILTDSGSRVVIAEDAGQLEKVREHWGRLPDLIAVVVIDPTGVTQDDHVLSLDALRQKGAALLAEQPDAVEEASDAVRPENLATLVYTSGTTGLPKGVRLRHSSWVYTGAAIAATGVMTEDDLHFLWLPLSHVFGKVLLTGQVTVGMPTAVDGDLEHLVDNLAAVRPTIMAGAPRIYEKVHSKIVTGVQAEGGLKLKIFSWAFGVGRKVSALRLQGEEPSGLLAVQHRLADKLVFSKIKERFGGRVRYFVSGAAALSQEIGEWFHAAGIVVLEGYGLTETSAASFVNRPDSYRFGVVGLPFPGTVVQLGDDGEILIGGPGVMEGYHNLPEQTGDVLTADGFVRTGDIGEITPEGFLRITDRKKDLIKTSGGKYVAPQTIESRFKAICPLASQFVVHGDGRNFVTALVTLDPDAVATWAQANGMGDKDYVDVVRSDQVHQLVQGYVDELNSTLNRWETIKRFEILPADLTVEDGELTPSMKLKRRVVERKYADLLDGMYGDGNRT
ncbi:MAG TPA: long-chain fatty acid--CoA ligase [Actinomycetales bacterium]|nr:long-chain fatty acid--CoA ligase [Actinomycetales bacterium]